MTWKRSDWSSSVVIWSAAISFISALPPNDPPAVLTEKGGTPTRGLVTPDGAGGYCPTFAVNVSAEADSFELVHPRNAPAPSDKARASDARTQEPRSIENPPRRG